MGLGSVGTGATRRVAGGRRQCISRSRDKQGRVNLHAGDGTRLGRFPGMQAHGSGCIPVSFLPSRQCGHRQSAL